MEDSNNNGSELHEKVKKFVDKIVEEKGLKNVKIEAKPAIAKGNNFLGVLTRIKVTGSKDGELTEINLISKMPIDDENILEKFPLWEVFHREIFVYTKLKPLYDELQNNLPESVKFKFANCYYTDLERNKECIILEDLTKVNFLVHPRLKRVDIDLARTTVREIAKLHALSFILERTNPEKYKFVVDNCYDLASKEWNAEEKREENLKFLNFRLDEARSALEREDLKEKITNFGSSIVEHIIDSNNPHSHSAIVHGDFWTSNMMFKFQDGKPAAVRFLDYQLTKVGSPAADVLYFIYSSTDGKLREEYYDELLETYYESLTGHLKALSTDVKDVYPRRVFYDQLRKSSPGCLAFVLMTLTLITRDETKTQNISEVIQEVDEKDSAPGSNSSELFKQRINDLIRDIVSYGYL